MVAFLSCCVGGSSGQNSGQPFRLAQRFEREPEDQTAVVGETVVMACRVLNKAGVLQWTKDDFGLGSDRNLSGFERYSMIGTEDEGKSICFTDVVYNFFMLKVFFACSYRLSSAFLLGGSNDPDGTSWNVSRCELE